jgi:hypothetical protein
MSIAPETLFNHRVTQYNRIGTPASRGSVPKELKKLVLSFHQKSSDEKLVLPFCKMKGQSVEQPGDDVARDGSLIRTTTQDLWMVSDWHCLKPGIILPSNQQIPVPVAYLKCFQHVSVSTVFSQERGLPVLLGGRLWGICELALVFIAVSFDNLEMPSSQKHRRLISGILPSGFQGR